MLDVMLTVVFGFASLLFIFAYIVSKETKCMSVTRHEIFTFSVADLSHPKVFKELAIRKSDASVKVEGSLSNK